MTHVLGQRTVLIIESAFRVYGSLTVPLLNGRGGLPWCATRPPNDGEVTWQWAKRQSRQAARRCWHGQSRRDIGTPQRSRRVAPRLPQHHPFPYGGRRGDGDPADRVCQGATRRPEAGRSLDYPGVPLFGFFRGPEASGVKPRRLGGGSGGSCHG